MRTNCANCAISMNMVNMKGAAMRQITITADKKYLLIPVGNVKGWTIPAESIQYLSIYQNGSLVEEYEVCLDASPRCWSCLYLERYAGETLELRLEGGDESLIELLEFGYAERCGYALQGTDASPCAYYADAWIYE